MTVKVSYKLEADGELTYKVLSDNSYGFDLAGNAGGAVLFSYEPSGSVEIDGTVYNAAGASAKGPFTIVKNGDYVYDPAVAALADGSFATAYQRDHFDDKTIEIQRTAANGAARGASVAVDSDSTNQADPDVAGLVGSNGFVVSWTQTSFDDDTMVELFKADGTKVAVDAVDASSASTTGSSVAGLKSGGFVVAFTQKATDDAPETMEFRLYDASGAALGAKVDADTTGSANDQVQALGLLDGGFALAYRDDGYGGSSDITLAIYDADGSARSGAIQANAGKGQGAGGYESTPAITQLANGLIAVSWFSYASNRTVVQARIFDAKGRALTDVTTLGQTSFSGSNAVASQGLGTFLAGWSDYNEASRLGETHGGQVNLVRYLTGDNTSEAINGSNGIDRVTANGGNDRIGLFGNDDKANGGLGNDVIRGGDGGDRLLGGAGNDTLYGDAGYDVLDGGAGRDRLTGGAGRDTFVFDQAVSPANLQTIGDYAAGSDSLFLDSRIYGKALGSSVDRKELVLGTHATQSTQHLIYDGSSGALYFDADGSGGADQVRIAQLGKDQHLTTRDFTVGHFTF